MEKNCFHAMLLRWKHGEKAVKKMKGPKAGAGEGGGRGRRRCVCRVNVCVSCVHIVSKTLFSVLPIEQVMMTVQVVISQIAIVRLWKRP